MTSLQGADKYLSAAVEKMRQQRKMSWRERLIDRANEVSIFDVLEDFFDHHVPHEGSSYKSKCPFAWEHEDGGMDKGFRTYPSSNSSMCFPMHGYMPPTRLVQTKFRIPAFRAAEKILDHYNLLQPRNYHERWADIMREREVYRDRIGNPQHAVSALQTQLQLTTAYGARQFDTDVSEVMGRILEALDACAKTNDPELVREWYKKSLVVMTKVIERKI